MRFEIYIDQLGSAEPIYVLPPLEPRVYEAQPSDRIRELADRAVLELGLNPEEDFFRICFLEEAGDKAPRGLIRRLRALIAEDGEFLWPEGAMDQITVADLERSRRLGFFMGDPHALLLEPPMGFDGVFPGWEDLLAWLMEGVVVGVAAKFITVVRGRFLRWRDRGARTPYAFLDVVLAREEWSGQELGQLLGLNEAEVDDLLGSLGFDVIDQEARRFVLSSDPAKHVLRKGLIEDWLHYAPIKVRSRLERPKRHKKRRKGDQPDNPNDSF